MPFGGGYIYYVHLVLLDLDDSGLPALAYVLPEQRTLVVHPQIGRTLGAAPLDMQPVGVFLDPREDGTTDLLVSFAIDDNGTPDDPDDDRGPFLDRYRVNP